MATSPITPAPVPTPRIVLDGVLTPEACAELVFVARACSVVSWRPNTASVTLHDLLASRAWPLLAPLLRAREAVREAVEGALGAACELLFEFTALITWYAGAHIGPHFDANRDYLSNRHYSAVCYLNDQGADFSGGDFRFADGRPDRVSPRAGRLLAYGTGPADVHSVDPVTRGERCVLTLWFTRTAEADQDAAIIRGSLFAELAAAVASGLAVPQAAWMHEEAYFRPPAVEEEEGATNMASDHALTAAGPACERDVRVMRAKQLGLVGFDAAADGAAEVLHRAAYARWRPGDAGYPAYLEGLWRELTQSVPRWREVGSLYAV